ncbi:MAG: lycopene beta-cyclase CrtY [Sphingomonadaceae bacterium]|uniref:lycopene beta-cyclase CrtY n=1 Tax=Thermaurantiacus sp. TaxID=2820283 RepID=UPI00298F0C4D|nr:lycopene beta-cyclase CrtY [Thermaurantiacus sp.]MCS6987696.1 lycopene beta-cyclase CrtY [Sphingomonadaceae bacterium]MDW8415085.1 lycopene beta-cyclase CrtY [Thermaurantiacus sp.]
MDCDVAIVGGGLSAGLVALALRRRRPELRVKVFEAGPTFGGNHTWSSFASDLSPEGQRLAEPLIAHRWPENSIRFPAYRRRFRAAYQSATSARLHAALVAALPSEDRHLGVPVAHVGAEGVVLADGRHFAARAVIDARGQKLSPYLDLGFQKFVGLEVELDAPHGLEGPIIMDATVPQHDGYRFVYVLPFSERTVLIEDTYYADGPALDRPTIFGRIRDYATFQGWRIARVLREEDGVLPIAIDGDIEAHLAQYPDGVAPVGMAAALFHPVTGYSFPDAVRLALFVARLPDLSGRAVSRHVRAYAADRWEERGFYRMLNKMLFRAAEPEQRWRVLQRFYGLDSKLVARFYASHCTLFDKVRILTGRPPVPFFRAVAVVMRG